MTAEQATQVIEKQRQGHEFAQDFMHTYTRSRWGWSESGQHFYWIEEEALTPNSSTTTYTEAEWRAVLTRHPWEEIVRWSEE